MARASLLLVLTSLFFWSCSNNPEVPQAVAIATTAPIERADQEVLVASNPAGARVLLKGAEVGQTPMKLLVRGDTNIVLEKEGYVKQALMITPKSDPNIVVDLVESGESVPENEAADEETEEDSPKKATEKKSGTKSKKKVDNENDAPVATAAVESEPEQKPEPEPEPKVSKPVYDNMRKIKDALRAGKITKAQFRMYQQEIRRKREIEYNALKAELKAGKITKAQYKQQIVAIRAKYEG